MSDAFLPARAAKFPDRIAIVDRAGSYRYRDLSAAAARVAASVAGIGDQDPPARVAFLVEPGFEHVAVQWGIWSAGLLAVPLAISHPPRELEQVLDDARPAAVIPSAELAERIAPLAEARGIPLLPATPAADTRPAEMRSVPPERPAQMIYTSGTTGRPKGVITTHANVSAQIDAVARAWEWIADDRVLHVLPLHHVHGIINALSCPLWCGATVEFLHPFDPVASWDRLGSGEITVFTAVPTIYARLIAAWEAADGATRDRWSAGARTLRLMMSGSAALPVGVLARWEELTGHRLLERYGMTEIGMALSNPLHGERRPGTVGQPLPGVEVRIVGDDLAPVADGVPGQLEVRGPQVFSTYWDRPEETAESFRGGWFRTGDVAVVEDGWYRLLGRQSVDIIKSAGYKVSALEVEEAIREHPAVADCAVVGLPDDELGERIAAAIVATDPIDPASLRSWLKERLAPYKIPRLFAPVAELPRNAMGKVTKPAVKAVLESRS